MSGTHLTETATHLKKRRIYCEVSEETGKMWDEILVFEEKHSNRRYYPAHTLEKLIKAHYKIIKAGFLNWLFDNIFV